MIRSWMFRAFRVVFARIFGTRVARAIWLVPGSRRLYRLLISRLRPEEVTVRGHVIRLDPLDSLLLSVNGTYEETELNLFRDCIRPGDTVLDIGGHIGLYALEGSQAVGKQGRVITFEPSSDNFAILEHNVNTNGCTNVELVRAAVSNHDGPLTLVLSRDNSGDHQVRADLGGQEEFEQIEAVTIDSYCERHSISDVAVIKMDIQGGEPFALAGARYTIKANRDLILFTEVSPAHLAARGGAQAYLQALESSGFDLWRLEAGRVIATSETELERLELDSRTDHADLVCTKGAGARARLNAAMGRMVASPRSDAT